MLIKRDVSPQLVGGGCVGGFHSTDDLISSGCFLNPLCNTHRGTVEGTSVTKQSSA